jgi:hypothetical protein
MVRVICAVAIALAGLGSAWAAAEPVSPTAQKQQDFKKMYGSADASERVKAVAELDGLTDSDTLSLLHYVVANDKIDSVRSAAFEQLTKVPARTPAHANILVALFQTVKPTDVELRLEMARLMANSQFKYAIADALSDFGSKLRYPDPWKGVHQGRSQSAGGGASTTTIDPSLSINRSRKEFEKFIGYYNEITKAGLKASDKNSPLEIKRWWEANKAKFAAGDREMADKYKAEDQAAKDKENPLVPEKKDKKG